MNAVLALTLLLTPVPGLAATQAIGNWQFEEKADPFTDARSVMAWVDAVDAEARLAVKCDRPGRQSVYVAVAPEQPLGYEGPEAKYPTVMWRLDDGKPADGQWKFVNDVGYLDGRPGMALATEFASAKRVAMRVWAWDGSSRDYAFDIKGAGDAMARVITACAPSS